MNCERVEEGQSRDSSMIMIKQKGWSLITWQNECDIITWESERPCGAGVWIISMQDRVSSVLEFVCSTLSLCSEEDGQTKQREFLYSIWDRESRKTPHERETDRGWWCMNHAPSCFQTESQLSSRLCGYGCLSPETDRQPEKQFESWLWQTQSRVSTINTSLLSLNVKSFNCRKSVQSFNLEDVVKTSTLTGSHRFCRTLLQKQQDFSLFEILFSSKTVQKFHLRQVLGSLQWHLSKLRQQEKRMKDFQFYNKGCICMHAYMIYVFLKILTWIWESKKVGVY